MRVLQVSTTYPPADISGVGTLVQELRHELERQGHEPLVLTRLGPAEDQAVIGLGGGKTWFPLRAALAFGRVGPVDVVHVHESDGVLVALRVRWERWRNRRRRGPLGPALVATLQVSYRRERLAVRAVRANGVVVSRPAFSERVFQLLRAPVHACLGRFLCRLADRVVAPSHATARELAEDYGARNVVVIPNGVVAAGPVKRAREGGKTRFLSVGRLRTRKAVGVLIEAFDRLRRERVDVELVIVGEGELERQVRAQALRLGTECVEFTGKLPRHDIARWLAAADVFVLPSIYEGFPLAILEAMAAGLPVIATRVAGNPEAVDDGESGLLVEPEDAEDLKRAMAELASQPDRMRAMGERGRQILIERFAISRVTAEHLALWRELGGAAHMEECAPGNARQ